MVLAVVLFAWFRDAIGESEGGLYSDRIDVSFRWSMSWFIFSEVMFFARLLRRAVLGPRALACRSLGDLDHQLLWPDFKAVWPSAAAGHGVAGRHVEPFTTMGPWPIPTINTALLLTSGVTLTIAHHALIAGQRARRSLWMWITVLLGITFLGFQAYEYIHAYTRPEPEAHLAASTARPSSC